MIRFNYRIRLWKGASINLGAPLAGGRRKKDDGCAGCGCLILMLLAGWGIYSVVTLPPPPSTTPPAAEPVKSEPSEKP